MQELRIHIPDTVDIEELIGGVSLKRYPPEIADMLRDQNTIIVSEALAEIICAILRVAVSLPEERRVYLEQPGYPTMAAHVAE